MTQLEKIEQAYLENREIPYTDDKRKFVHMDAVYDETMRAYFYDGFVSRDAEIVELVDVLTLTRTQILDNNGDSVFYNKQEIVGLDELLAKYKDGNK